MLVYVSKNIIYVHYLYFYSITHKSFYRRSRASSRGSVFDLLNTPTNCTLSVSAPGSRRGSKPSISIEQEPDPESYGKKMKKNKKLFFRTLWHAYLNICSCFG